MGKRVVIIGAGPCGLAAIKSCLEVGLLPVCLEQSDSIGGIWDYSPELREGRASVMRSTITNVSKEMTNYSDFPMPSNFPNFMRHTKLLEYLHLYADHFHLKQYIQFHSTVKRVEKVSDGSVAWEVKVEDSNTSETRQERCDAVMVCTGHYAGKNMAHFPGLEEFRGEVLHSADYREPDKYVGKTVVVVGCGNSAFDIATELSTVTEQTYVASRRGGAWVVSRLLKNGVPTDMFATRRISQYLKNHLPHVITNKLAENVAKFDHEAFGIKPRNGILQQSITVNEDVAQRIAFGALKMKPNVTRITANSVEFEDGSNVDNIDAIILATGYRFSYPFLDKSVLDVVDNDNTLYKYVFPPDLQPASLAVIGKMNGPASVIPMAEMQCRWVTRVFKGVTELPSKGVMLRHVANTKRFVRERFYRSQRHNNLVEYIPYMDSIAEEFGAKPDLGRLFCSDPLLWKQVVLGPATPFQYRLHGPSQWTGAREAIMNQWQRMRAPYESNKATKGDDEGSMMYMAVLVVFVVIIIAFSFGIFS